ncbi:helix-turn-helix domain-containing protein [uncultured Aquimarina sp.]|uniref:helix-turn-helix domain-containing protein n=1 Tax=uncultured Aquimarina sp. TaxID=575652 RepID=UPI00260DF533|nr:helix-turn-helix domain-containing protein [uncultured Aquimarina sp.]
MNYNRLFFKFLFFLLFTNHIIAFQQNQEINSNEDSYQFLAEKFYENEGDTIQARRYAHKYLLKAKKANDTINVVNGYYFMSLISKSPEAHKYSDTIIRMTKNSNLAEYPMYSYYHRAALFFNEGDFKKAFDYFLKVYEEAKKHNNIGLEYASKKNIGILKALLGENETALINLRDCYTFFAKHKKQAPVEYLELLFALSESYNFNKILDSASVINHLGYKESINLNHEELQYYFILNEGINHFSKENYSAAKDSLFRSIELMEDNDDLANLGQARYYLGESLSVLGYKDLAIEEHKKVDAIFQRTPLIIPESRKSYEILIKHYKDINDTSNQLKYIERLLRVDSILNSNYKYLIKNVVQNYDTPRLLAEKQEIINSLEKGGKTSILWILLLSMLSLLSILFLGFNYAKNRKYKKRFDELFLVSNLDKVSKDKEITINKKDAIGIDERIVEDVLDRLLIFEQNLGFLKRNITTNSLAKSFSTNSKYLSKIINAYKEKNFNTYINELRIEYAVEKLKTDGKFKKYSIRAIAHEAGFNSTEVFSKAFYKKNGIHPSYFIKLLEKHQQS